MSIRDLTISSAVLLLFSLLACQKEGTLTGEKRSISFSTQETKSELSTLFTDFKVWASTQSGSSKTELMPGYRVNYLSGDWTYINGEGTDSQEEQFWSHSIDQYHFHAGAPFAKVRDISSGSLTLDLRATTEKANTALFTKPYTVSRTNPDFGNTVCLNFIYANCRVNVAIKCKSVSEQSISDIKLVPLPPAAYATSCRLRIDYDWDRYSLSFTATDRIESSEGLDFETITIPAQTSSAIESPAPRYMIPDAKVIGQWKVTLKLDGVDKEASFSIDKAWESGKSYLYRFDCSDQANLVFLGTDTDLFFGHDLENGEDHTFN